MAKFTRGQSGNPGGMTPEQAEARKILSRWLHSKDSLKEFQAAYMGAVQTGNATIIVDFANRLMGKVKEEIELGESADRPFKGAALDKLLALADSLKK